MGSTKLDVSNEGMAAPVEVTSVVEGPQPVLLATTSGLGARNEQREQ